ncbi:acyltransferase [Pseudomonas fluorescens]|uniref:Acyltransferase 3 domain-containing protein n=1 Tax=Pseudomonas fluorescens TaxID=294 RepID=A0A0F4TM05_PSEFL|nr:acyltransferase [Pseudomonas fluorescens]KJZ45463.1 hypothetical protein VC35_15480 [Pseudomonas fluorescens]
MSQTLEVVALYAVSIFLLDKLYSHIKILSPDTLKRSSPLDALRGFLATSVVCHHFTITYFWKTTGYWARTGSPIIDNMGSVSVSLFFMITGFLFFDKIYQKKPNWPTLLKSRIKRVYPLYIFVVFLVMVLSLYKTGFISTPTSTIIKETYKWLIFLGSPFNGYQDSNLITAYAHWTLKYEWLFYISLPVIALIANFKAQGTTLVLSLLGTLALLHIYGNTVDVKFFTLFIIGFVPVLIKNHFPTLLPHLKKPICSAIALLAIALSLFFKEPYPISQMLLLGIPFLMFSLGNDLFGILSRTGLKALGEISYSIYLLHGTLLFFTFSILPIYNFTDSSFSRFALLLPLILLIVSAMSTFTYFAIERPFLRKKSLYGSAATARPGNIDNRT